MSDAEIRNWLEGWNKKFGNLLYGTTKISFHNVEEKNLLEVARENMGRLGWNENLEVYIAAPSYWYKFTLTTMPSCCGIVVLQYVSCSKFNHIPGTCSMILDFAKDLCLYLDYTQIFCSMIALNERQRNYTKAEHTHTTKNHLKFEQNLEKAGFKLINEFKNTRSNNLIRTFYINLQ